MIRNQWYVILESKEVQKKPIGIRRLGENLVLWRDAAGVLTCFVDQCTHRGAKLSLGHCFNGNLQCPFHGMEFDTKGNCLLIPANGKNAPVPDRFRIKTYPVFEKEGWIWIFWGDIVKITNPPLYFKDIDASFINITRQDKWNIHYSRCIENQLDIPHLPFVHRKTIGRGGRSLVDGPLVKWINESMFFVFVYNRTDNGTPAKKPAELMEPPENTFRLEFIFPNLWQNHISPKMRIVIAFVPVDEYNTILYIRFQQKFFTLPILGSFFNTLFMPFNMRILHEDRRVVLTQRPGKTALVMDENLIQGDLPIIGYRKRRQELIESEFKNGK
jgi:phenylpropionate dioxygenase-like ring-hydroxylating dioxygenase large terminal subunit